MKDVKRPGYICIRNELRLAKSLPFVRKALLWAGERYSQILPHLLRKAKTATTFADARWKSEAWAATSETVELDQKRSEAWSFFWRH